jgi:hypothetical protein
MANVQFNVALPAADARRVKRDAIKLGVTLGSYAQLALELFLARPVRVRRAGFSGASSRRKAGRKITA